MFRSTLGFAVLVAGFCRTPAAVLERVRIVLPHNASTRVRVLASELLLAEATRHGIARRWTVVVAAPSHFGEEGEEWKGATPCSDAAPCIWLQLGAPRPASFYASSPAWPCPGLRLGEGRESFVLCSCSAGAVLHVAARTELALAMGIGRLLRELRAQQPTEKLLARRLALAVDPPPWAAMRGQQLTDWGFQMGAEAAEQLVKELIVFGTNQIELAHIQLGGDDPGESRAQGAPPCDPAPCRDDSAALVRFAALAHKYGIALSLYNPPWPSAKMDAALAAMARVDAVLGESGEDPNWNGTTTLRGAAAAVRRHHPAAAAWHCPGGRNATEQAAWLGWLAQADTRSWLDGVVFGPSMHFGPVALLASLAAAQLPYKVRLYPDLCHTLTCMLPVPDWHRAWAFTHGREPAANPQPAHHGAAVRTCFANATFAAAAARVVGFGGYSEGAGDDFNKALWAALYLEPALSPATLTRQYSAYFLPLVTGAATATVTARATADVGEALLVGLERNWQGDAAANEHVLASLVLAQQLERAAACSTGFGTAAAAAAFGPPGNWRTLSLVFRAYYDAHVQARLRFELQREALAYEALAAAVTAVGAAAGGAAAARLCNVTAARAILHAPWVDVVAEGWLSRLHELAAAINASDALCSSGCTAGGMAILASQAPLLNLDTIGTPLADARFLLAALNGSSGGVSCDAVQALLNWTVPGPGGFYDELGASPRNARLPAGAGPAADPGYYFAPLVQFNEDPTRWAPCGDCGAGDGPPARRAWHQWAQTYGDTPLSLRYAGLDPAARYRVRLVYAFQGWGERPVARLYALGGRGGGEEAMLHDYIPSPVPARPLEFDIPRRVTAGGEVTVECRQPPGSAQVGESGRGCLIAEVWLLRVKTV